MSHQLSASKSATVAVLPKSATVADLTKSAKRIQQYHDGCLQAFNQQMGYAFLAGLELTRAKELCEHGEFMKWREEHLPQIPERTAQRYMKFSAALSTKSATVADLKDQLLIGDGKLKPEQEKEVLAVVYEEADGKTLTDMYRDLGVIREPREKEYHPPKDRTPAEEAAEQRAAAEELITNLIGSIRQVTDDTTLALASDALRRELLGTAIDLNTKLRAIIAKTPKKRAKKKGTK